LVIAFERECHSLFLDFRFNFAGGVAEFTQGFANSFADIGQFAWAKDNQGQGEDQEQFGTPIPNIGLRLSFSGLALYSMIHPLGGQRPEFFHSSQQFL
jgi:hypothetical protein